MYEPVYASMGCFLGTEQLVSYGSAGPEEGWRGDTHSLLSAPSAYLVRGLPVTRDRPTALPPVLRQESREPGEQGEGSVTWVQRAGREEEGSLESECWGRIKPVLESSARARGDRDPLPREQMWCPF